MRRALFLLLIASFTYLPTSLAQETASTERYQNDDLGIAFNLPSGWEVRTTLDTLLAGEPASLDAVELGGVPETLVIRVVTASFTDLNLGNATELPGQLVRLLPDPTTAPEPRPTTYGNVEGWEIDYTLPDSNLHSRVAILNLVGGRLALVRGIASLESWQNGAAEQFDSLKNTFEFTLPERLADPLATLPDEDGGVLWHYQASQPADSREIRLGGLAYDPFNLMYAAAGQRGVLVIDQTNGAFVNYLGPWFDDDNLVDIAINPSAKIFLANATPGDNYQIMVVNRAGGFEYAFGTTGDGPGQFAPGMPRTIAVTRKDEIWTVSEGHSTPPTNRLYHFDKWGNLLQMIDLADINPDLKNVRLDNNVSTSALYLIGETGGLNLLDADGNALVTNLGLEVFSFATPVDIAIAPGDNIIVATDSAGFLEFAPSGALLDRFGFPYDSGRTDAFKAGETLFPAGMVVGPNITVYFSETNPGTGYSQVQSFRFTGDGNLPLPNRPSTGQSVVVEQSLGIDPASGGGKIEYGAVVQGNLNNQYPLHYWTFTGEAGDRIRITMRDISPEQTLDTQIILQDPNVFDIATNDDLEGDTPEGFRSTDSVIEIELKAYGFYTIKATRFGGRGEYELSLEKLSN